MTILTNKMTQTPIESNANLYFSHIWYDETSQNYFRYHNECISDKNT